MDAVDAPQDNLTVSGYRVFTPPRSGQTNCMWRDLRDNWHDGGYWHWWWRDAVSGEMKLVLALAIAIAVALAGFLSAEAMSSASESPLTSSQQVVTLRRTVVQKVVHVRTVPDAKRSTRVVTRDHTVYLPGRETTVTHSVTVPGPDRVVTRSHVVTVVRHSTVSLPVTVSRSVTVLQQAPPVTATVTQNVPGPTVTRTTNGPGRTVTREVTTPGKTVTVTQVVTVTTPGKTVTNPVTQPVTVTTPGAIVTVTVTVPKPKP